MNTTNSMSLSIINTFCKSAFKPVQSHQFGFIFGRWVRFQGWTGMTRVSLWAKHSRYPWLSWLLPSSVKPTVDFGHGWFLQPNIQIVLSHVSIVKPFQLQCVWGTPGTPNSLDLWQLFTNPGPTDFQTYPFFFSVIHTKPHKIPSDKLT